MNNHSQQPRNTNRTEGESQSQQFVCVKLDNGSPADANSSKGEGK